MSDKTFSLATTGIQPFPDEVKFADRESAILAGKWLIDSCLVDKVTYYSSEAVSMERFNGIMEALEASGSPDKR